MYAQEREFVVLFDALTTGIKSVLTLVRTLTRAGIGEKLFFRTSMQFVPLNTFIDASFWSEVNRKKLEEWKLNEDENAVGASFSICEVLQLRIVGKTLFQMITVEAPLGYPSHTSLSRRRAFSGGQSLSPTP